MHRSPNTSPPSTEAADRRRLRRCARRPLVLLLICPLLTACGAAAPTVGSHTALIVGARRGTAAGPWLAAAYRLADRFAAAYARGAYRRHPPRLPGATAAVGRAVGAAAERVPPARRRLRPRVLALTLQPRGAATLAASVRIGDGHSTPFSVGFTVGRVGSGWRVIAISLPN